MKSHISIGSCKLIRPSDHEMSPSIYATYLRKRFFAPKCLNAILQVANYCRVLDTYDSLIWYGDPRTGRYVICELCVHRDGETGVKQVSKRLRMKACVKLSCRCHFRYVPLLQQTLAGQASEWDSPAAGSAQMGILVDLIAPKNGHQSTLFREIAIVTLCYARSRPPPPPRTRK